MKAKEITWASAHGNHVTGYTGVAMAGKNTEDPAARITWECPHRHPHTGEARECARTHMNEPQA